MRAQRMNRVVIRTPEGVTFSFELAGPLSRFLSWLLDLVVVLLLLNLTMVPAQMVSPLAPGLALALNVLAYFLISVGYGMVLEWRWNGQTLGKRLLRLRVMDEKALPLTFPQLAIRNLMRSVDGLPGLYLLGGLACVLSPKAQRLGDIAAGTVVVRLADTREPDLSQIGGDKYNSFRQYGTLCARLRQAVPPAEADTALQALIRRNRLRPDARVTVFRELADRLACHVTFPAEATDGLSDEQIVRNIVDIVYNQATRGR